MDDIKILDAVERYIRGEMNPDERLHFENLRKTNPEVDQMVVEHTLFLQQLNHFGERKSFKSKLNEVHTDLTEQGKINSMRLKGSAKIVYLWKRYKRVTAIAACIAGITAIVISALIWAIAPKPSVSGIEDLKGQIEVIKDQTKNQDKKITNIEKQRTRENEDVFTSGGTGFIIDAKGYLVTNAHVIAGARYIAVWNKRGDYMAKVVYTDTKKDIAILKIDDDNFKPYNSLPYSISRNLGNRGEEIFTLGYPKTNEIVYSQGYLSALTGYNGDTLSCQIGMGANHGNSGSPIMNKNGEVIGILNGRQRNVVDFTFAIKSVNIYRALEELKEDTSYQRVKLNSKSSIAGLSREDQVKKVEDYIYLVKVN